MERDYEVCLRYCEVDGRWRTYDRRMSRSEAKRIEKQLFREGISTIMYPSRSTRGRNMRCSNVRFEV